MIGKKELRPGRPKPENTETLTTPGTKAAKQPRQFASGNNAKPSRRQPSRGQSAARHQGIISRNGIFAWNADCPR